MKYWARWACVLGGACLLSVSPARAEDAAPAAAAKKSGIVVDIKTDRIVLMDIALAGNRLVAVGERGFTMVSDDAGTSWKSIATPVTRTLTGIAFKDAKVGVAVGHGASVVRTDDGGTSWTHVPLPEAEPESLLGVTHLDGDRFVTYGAFGMYFESADAGRTWQKRMVLAEDFERAHFAGPARSETRSSWLARRGRWLDPTTAVRPGPPSPRRTQARTSPSSTPATAR